MNLMWQEDKETYNLPLLTSRIFNTLNRDMLYYKLLKYGISGLVHNIINVCILPQATE